MIDWSQAEQVALADLINGSGPLQTGLQKFVAACVDYHRTNCTACMASVPRNPEVAADHAAKAQVLDEFFIVLTDYLKRYEVPSQEPTLQGMEG